MQPITIINPIHHFAVIARASMLKGSGFVDLWPNFLALFAITLVLGSLSVWRFRKNNSARTERAPDVKNVNNGKSTTAPKPFGKRICSAMLLVVTSVALFGQSAPPAGPAQPARATQEPLSGRTAQSGSVTAAESPVPGTTTSVNTLNPTIQVQGPFAGAPQARRRFPANSPCATPSSAVCDITSELRVSRRPSGKPTVKAEWREASCFRT